MLVDLRNHGQSAHAATMAFQHMADDVRELLDRENIQRAVLCGHSLGGKVAMALALSDPDRVDRLVVLDIAPVVYEDGDGSSWGENVRLVNACTNIDVNVIKKKNDADRQLERVVSDPNIRAFMLMNLVRRTSGEGFAWRLNLDGIHRSLDELAGWSACEDRLYGGNTLFVAGGKSRYLRSSHLPAISTLFSRFSVSTIRNAAHWIHADEPEALLLMVSNFLRVPQA